MAKRNWKCPICHQPVEAAAPEFPFCSRRCRTVDLGNWASEKYVIHSPVTDPEAFEEALAESEREQEERQRRGRE